MKVARFVLIALFAATLAACDNGPITPTDTDTVPTPAASPVTETFSSQLGVGGFASRSFNAAKAGTVTITLNSAGSSSTLKVGLALGIPDQAGTGCLFTRATEIAAGGVLTSTVDAGVYCVRISDLGTLTSTINFTATIVRP